MARGCAAFDRSSPPRNPYSRKKRQPRLNPASSTLTSIAAFEKGRVKPAGLAWVKFRQSQLKLKEN